MCLLDAANACVKEGGESVVAFARSAAIQQRKPVFIKPIVGG